MLLRSAIPTATHPSSVSAKSPVGGRVWIERMPATSAPIHQRDSGQRRKRRVQKLEISAKTVENHRTNLMRKLGVHDVAGVIRYVVRQGLYDPSEG